MRRFPAAGGPLLLLFPAMVALLAGLTAAADPPPGRPAMAAAIPEDVPVAAPDSAEGQPDTTRGGAEAAEEPSEPEEPQVEEFHPDFVPDNMDSTAAAYDAAIPRSRAGKLFPKFGVRYSKAEGVHLELGAASRDALPHLSYVEARGGYDFSRRRVTGLMTGRIRVVPQSPLFLELSAHTGIRSFGNCDPYGNTLMALFGGYDVRQYLREREGSALLTWRFTEERQIGFGWVRVLQDSVPPVADPIFGSRRWMRRHDAIDPVRENGFRFMFHRRPRYTGETVLDGLVTTVEGTTYGGPVLGGDREYTKFHGDLWYTYLLPSEDAWHVKGSASLAAGRAPRQALADLGGAAGLKAFPPRGTGTQNSLIGTSRLFSRVEYQEQSDLLRDSSLPILRKLGLKFVPFAEAGAVWGQVPILRARDLRAPRRGDVRWDLGIGLRRDINASGPLSHAQIDFAWPMGSDTGPVRITLLLSSNGLD